MDGHHVTAKQKGQVRIQICDDNGDTFIATLHNVLLATDLCDRLSRNDECSSENYGDSSQLTNWILDSRSTFHMTLEVSDFMSDSLEDTDKYI